ncbi:N-alpha-acetyltransferase 50 [Nosema granulosis]|uniref:N-alpha-acetyltransferase 50 n=1 Tax=Nosema granulosis TaxID=83296 RepID=A0A9P6GYH1_9MICR|nr:N-alpha-acetyltransferase 50 [Nosema granulosis]
MVRISLRNIETMESMNSALFPVHYKDTFSLQILFKKNTFGFLFYEEDYPVGLCTFTFEKGRVYVMTFGILVRYRRRGIGRRCMSLVEEYILQNIGDVLVNLHVHESNHIGIRFYVKMGYKQVGIDHLYYLDMVPRTAYILEKNLKYHYE